MNQSMLSLAVLGFILALVSSANTDSTGTIEDTWVELNEVDPSPLPPILHLTWNTDGEEGSKVDWNAALALAGIEPAELKAAAIAPLIVVYGQELTTGTIAGSGATGLEAILTPLEYKKVVDASLDGHSGGNSVLRKKIKVAVYQREPPDPKKGSPAPPAKPLSEELIYTKAVMNDNRFFNKHKLETACNTMMGGLINKTEKGAAGVKICRKGNKQCMQFHTVHLPDKPAEKRMTCIDTVLQAAPKAADDELVFFVGDFNARIWVSPEQIKDLKFKMGAEGIIEGKTNFQKILDSKKFGKNWPRLQDSNFHGSPENGNIGKSLDEQMKESAKMRTTKDPTDLKNDVGLKYRLPTPTYTVLGGRKFAGKTPALEDNNLYSPDLKGIAGGYRTGFDEATEIGLKEKDAAIEKGNFLDSIAYLDQIAANGNAWKGYPTFHVGVYPGANKGIEDHAFTVWEAVAAGGSTKFCKTCKSALSDDTGTLGAQ